MIMQMHRHTNNIQYMLELVKINNDNMSELYRKEYTHTYIHRSNHRRINGNNETNNNQFEIVPGNHFSHLIKL